MSTHADTSSRPKVRTDLDLVRVDDELVIWDGRLDRVHRIDPVGTLLWQFLDGTATIGELADDVADVFEIDPPAALASVIELRDQLEAAGLLHDDEAPPPHEHPQRDDRFLRNPPVP